MARSWLIPAIGALAAGFLMVPAQAAPTSGVASGLKIAASENAGVQKVHRRAYRYRYHRQYHIQRSHRHLGYYRWRKPGIHLHLGHRRHHGHHNRRFRRW
jgi:hypothetical protein